MEAKSLVLGCFLSFVTILVLFPTPTEAGECCQYRSFLYGRRTRDSQWCPVYCCYFRLSGTYGCCGDITIRAPYHDRSAFCKDWFTFRSNMWAPILIAIIALLIVLCCVFACCHLCCFCF